MDWSVETADLRGLSGRKKKSSLGNIRRDNPGTKSRLVLPHDSDNFQISPGEHSTSGEKLVPFLRVLFLDETVIVGTFLKYSFSFLLSREGLQSRMTSSPS